MDKGANAEAYEQGLIYQSKPGSVPQEKRYLDEMKDSRFRMTGAILNIFMVQMRSTRYRRKSRWRAGADHPSQQQSRDVVLDPFCAAAHH